ncbi:hypothetical protein [Citrobacter farmeri]|uniref:hypothetical protein n=1 Tax=Citrobacter farmeri TaxID=67824 RepID=UPI00339C1172
MASCSLIVDLKFKWWIPVYIKLLTLFCMMTRCKPDPQVVAAFIVKHGIDQTLAIERTKETTE